MHVKTNERIQKVTHCDGSLCPFNANASNKLMEIAIVRAAHLHLYFEELKEIGVSVESELARSRLPHWTLDDPDAYVSFALCLEWLAGCSRDFELMDFGFLSARRATLGSLSPPFLRAILDAPTGFARFNAFLRCASLEDNVLSIRMQPEGDQVRVISTMEGFQNNPFIGLAEWVDLQAMISIVRSVAGPRWCPQEMTFVSRQRPTPIVHEAFPNTRILVGKPCTSILVSKDLLARPCTRDFSVTADDANLQTRAIPDEDIAEWNFAKALREVVRPYLPGGYPALREMAEALQMSERTLQRRLQHSGRSYSDIVQEARFDLARALLVDPSTRIIDVALAVGYENQQHFSRAFRRIAGVSPTGFRKSIFEMG
ncbi:helix-turn-helix domain-containing protein [Roseibium aggregatum]|jgi:AraC-like DNA-binding protein|uniref:AraC family transcriptional regulator n=1 Tax=Roseibium aggregatum TaxID=187304 RepID=UPI003A97A0C3